ncbi:MAG: alpha/beta hydrolase [Candidatus Cryptobacteroides sp.]
MFSFFRKPDYKVYGPQGGINIKVQLPDGFDAAKDKCPVAVLMHGFMAAGKWKPITTIARQLAQAGIASISMDFDAHGRSEGKFIDMTISSEIADALAVVEYARKLPYASAVYFVGHSQGGVVAAMSAGRLAGSGQGPDALVLLAPAAVLKDDAIKGQCMNARYDPQNPPEYVNVMFHKLGRKFILEAQKLPIYETSALYKGPVSIIHGTEDKIVPVSYSERYCEIFPSAEYNLLEGEGHMMTGASVAPLVVKFLTSIGRS